MRNAVMPTGNNFLPCNKANRCVGHPSFGGVFFRGTIKRLQNRVYYLLFMKAVQV